MLGRARQVLVSRPPKKVGATAKGLLKALGGLLGALQGDADSELGAAGS